ncbi:MAG: hypothetical protein ACWGPN_16895 [Gammaproteobacteria bacterium]
MKHAFEGGALFLAGALLAFPAAAQWATYEKPGAEDWAALADLPDFSGVWERGGGGGRGRGGGSTLSPTPEYAAMRDRLRAASGGESQATNCLPPGMPGIMTQPYPMEFLLTPGKVTIVIEAYTQVRHIYTDGRELPEFPDPGFFGTSIGHWEGDTLVVESVGFSDLVQIAAGLPHSEHMRITERFSLVDDDTMQIETTITDPLALTEPYTTLATLRRHRDWTIAEYICEENNRNFVDSSGDAGVILDNPGGLPPPPPSAGASQ